MVCHLAAGRMQWSSAALVRQPLAQLGPGASWSAVPPPTGRGREL